MAFLSKIGNILRQTANKQIRSELSPFKLSIHQAVRCMSSMASSKLFIGGISYQTDEQSLREAFAKARIISDRETGRSRGFGFITFTSSEEASSAIQALDGQELHGRRVRVNYATDRPRPNFSDGRRW
ncbi:glycine-rich RNA-binding protein blt801 [Prunus yedoensis var. nudiflora]|uniref:Glycine-rich RNA-binding protein blt801 n=1 Tax=Prunus yedoensis var. nudiflora TaxID=2094558 RepID=A0A314UZ84_PRUYE|nr:glycine-rich RNA-binding protein blt801 [Prunus yedoensis var. nudiflora]